jgi:BASS family bile acid:Na+ symporter
MRTGPAACGAPWPRLHQTGIHNSTLAIFVAVSVLGDFKLMVPAAIYSVSMYVLATAFGFLVLGRQPAVVEARA